jgi:tRNA-specific 2-thiouridylase
MAQDSMTKKSKGSKGLVAVAMSGGVDSSVAAALLKEEGFEVIGITMNLFSLPKEVCLSEDLRSCCGWKAQEDASRVAKVLGIPHYIVDFRREFEESVIADFCREYGLGRTPNPCIRCNQFIKFSLLLDRAKRLGADFVATGHYARTAFDTGSNRWLLKKALDAAKDQSYFLYPLTQDELSGTLFPLGGWTKNEIRRLAARYELPVARKPESQEICFIPDQDYPRFLKERVPEVFRPGPIVDLGGKTIGEHNGIVHFTVGQRRGMGIAAPHPLYVIEVDAERNTIVAGKNEDLHASRLEASNVNWISIEKLEAPMAIRAKIRSKQAESRAKIVPQDSETVLVEFEKLQRAVTPGQAVVFYDDDTVVGGGIIVRALD